MLRNRPSSRRQHSQRRNGTQKRHIASNPRVPQIKGQKPKDYAPGSPERADLVTALKKVRSQDPVEIPVVIDGKEIFTGDTFKVVMPSDHQHVLAVVHRAGPKELKAAVESADKARHEWSSLPQHHRSQVFRRAADLLVTKHNAHQMAVSMLNISKTPWQGEIDCIAEQADFLRHNANFAEEIANQQPPLHDDGVWNRLKYRPLEGVIAAISPFNFTAIGTNLCAAPAVMGNTTLWKPASTSVYANYVAYNIMREAGIPDGVINFVPSQGSVFSDNVIKSSSLAGVHFTGSTEVFGTIWKDTANNLSSYRTFPRIVGETGGKNFHFVHPTADIKYAALKTVRAAFEYQGQKCSACSRAYVPKSKWEEFKTELLDATSTIKMGQPDDMTTFMGAVIDLPSAQKHKKYIDEARNSNDSTILYGGNVDTTRGYFVEPTIIVTTNPHSPTMTTELFGPIVTVYVYDDSTEDGINKTLDLVDTTSTYGLTGAAFARDRYAITNIEKRLINSCGNFYINDACTGAVVGQQAFGGARQSGTNDKAGSVLNLIRWTSPQSVKETSTLINNYTYPHMM